MSALKQQFMFNEYNGLPKQDRYLADRSFYYARHGHTEHNRKIIAGARTDSVLTEKGREQYRQQGKIWPLLPVRPGCIFCSTLVRSQESAEIGNAASGLKLDIYPLADLREQDYGYAEGTPFIEDISILSEFEWYNPPGGDRIGELQERLIRGYNRAFEIFDQKGYEGVPLFITHGGHPYGWFARCLNSLRSLNITDLPNASLFWLEPDNSLLHHGFAHRITRVHYDGAILRWEKPDFCMSRREKTCCQQPGFT
jgi:probable phosphoglycerate mutase